MQEGVASSSSAGPGSRQKAQKHLLDIDLDALGTQAIYGAEAGYDFSKFVLLTSTYHSPYSLAVGPKTPYKSLADLKSAGKPISFCTTGGIDMAYSVIGAKAIGFPFRLVPGYKGAPKWDR